MKKLSFVKKIIFIVNTLVAFLLLLAYAASYIPPKTIAILSILSLTVPLLILLNAGFLLYWLVNLKKQWLLSAFCLLPALYGFPPFYKFSGKNVMNPNNISIMSYNVRLFNLYKWIDEEDIELRILDFIKNENPDILCIQEFYPLKNGHFDQYAHKYIVSKGKRKKRGQAVFSKFPIVNSGSLDFEHSTNNALFADIIIKEDTLRVYNLHLESLHLNPDGENFGHENSSKLLSRITHTFELQQKQLERLIYHRESCSYKTVVCGDFNTTAFSYGYRQIKKGMKDAFEESGKGFGSTHHLKYFPLRIDYILSDDRLDVNGFKRVKVSYSDHYPILARIAF